MNRTISDDLWDMLHAAGVRRCYGIVGDALNPTIESLARHPEIEFVHVRHEEWGAFAASAEAQISGAPVAVCGTAGPGVTHLLNGLLDARHERASVIALAGDVETELIDTAAVEEVSPYDLFSVASLYTGRVVNASQARAVFHQAITVALDEQGPTVIALPGDVARADSPLSSTPTYRRASGSVLVPDEAAIQDAAALINGAGKVMIFGGDGCRDAAGAVAELATKLAAPVGYTLKGKNWLEGVAEHAVGMTGLLGYGGCHDALKNADVVLMLGADFPFPGFLDVGKAAFVQVDTHARHLGRRVEVQLGVQADVSAFIEKLLPAVEAKSNTAFLDECLEVTRHWRQKLGTYADEGHTPIRPEYLVSVLDELLGDDAIVTVDTGTPVIWAAHHLHLHGNRTHLGSYSWASMADASPYAFGAWKAAPERQIVALCGDGGFSMLALGDLITEVQQRARVVHLIFDNQMLDFVNIEQQEAGMIPWGTDLPNPNFAAIAEAYGAKGIRIEDPARLREQLQEALDHQDGPVVVDVLTDRNALALPAGVPLKTVKGFTLSVLRQATHGHLRDVVREGIDNLRLL